MIEENHQIGPLEQSMFEKSGTFIGIGCFQQGKKRWIDLCFQLQKTEKINSIPQKKQ